MRKIFLQVATILAATLMFSACQNPVIESDNQLSSSEVVPSSWVKLSNDAIVLNAMIDLPNATRSSNQTYTIQALYTSALGNTCMQASNLNSAEIRVLCQATNDYWQPMPFLNRVTP